MKNRGTIRSYYLCFKGMKMANTRMRVCIAVPNCLKCFKRYSMRMNSSPVPALIIITFNMSLKNHMFITEAYLGYFGIRDIGPIHLGISGYL